MYRLLSASKDTYITDKIVEGSRATDANVGQAGTLDLFKLFDETELTGVTGSIVEISRILLQFDYSTISSLDMSDPSFTASVVLKDVYGGQTVPSNYTLVLHPLSKSWDEGRGFDVVSYKDIDVANFLSASTTVTWSISGANSLGALGQDVDVVTDYAAVQTFARGDEEGSFNVTTLVSASVAGILPNHGFRISFSGSQETDSTTRFVKRFGSRHTFNKSLHPKLVIEHNDRIKDTGGYPHFSISQSLFTYNQVAGNYRNFVSGSSEVTGTDSLILELVASKSYSYTTSSWQPNFSASINHLTSSVVYYTTTFSASQYDSRPGVYTSNLMLDPTTTPALHSFLSGSSLEFEGRWKSLDGTTVFAKEYYTFKKPLGISSNSQEINYVVNAVNLKDEYTKDDQARVRVVAQDRSTAQTAMRYPVPAHFVIIPDMRWRLVKPYDGSVEVVPFSRSTRMSTDKEGMYFDLYIQDLDVNEVYELEFLIKNDVGKDVHIQNKGFIFKVIP